ncbi:MAG: hypothetical protein BWK80_04560 [Desulfobacteraceae bacterium IS3]|nr:MAG: hypothetical protein BWK80_04560 [Desulfobacteraceae bacterium IS3]
MKTVSVSRGAAFLNDILKQAMLEEIILETPDGQRFILASVEKWKGFQLAEDDDITQNKELINHLSNRRSGGKRISLSEVKEKLGL